MVPPLGKLRTLNNPLEECHIRTWHIPCGTHLDTQVIRIFKRILDPEHTSTREPSFDFEMPSIVDQEKRDELQSPITSQDVEKAHPQAKSKAPLDWDGDDDPENPWNWSLRKRVFHIVPPAVISFTA